MRFKITSPYGVLEEIRDKAHTGIDFKMESGTPIHAIQDGIIHLKDYGDANAGKTILLEMEDGKTAIFGHLKDFAVRDGQRVHDGQLIAHSGNTGHSTGPHLHFGLKDSTGYLDPSGYVDDIQQMGNNGGGFWDRFLENGQVNQFEHADFSIWQHFFGMPGQEIAILAGVLILLLLIKPIRTYVIGLIAAVLLILGGFRS